MSGGDVSLYLSASSFARIDSLVAFVPNAEGGVVIRVVDDDVWPAIPKVSPSGSACPHWQAVRRNRGGR